MGPHLNEGARSTHLVFPAFILIFFIPSSIGGNGAKSSGEMYFTMTSVRLTVPWGGLAEGKPLLRAKAVSEDQADVSEGNGHHHIYYRLAKPSRLLRLNPDSGDLFLSEEAKAMEADSAQARGKDIRVEEATVEVFSNFTTPGIVTSDASKRMTVQIALLAPSDGNNSYCEDIQQQSLCFWDNFSFNIMENREPSILGSFRPSFLPELCPQYSASYTIVGGSNDLFQVSRSNEGHWHLKTKRQLDREALEWVAVELDCRLNNRKQGFVKHHRRRINITILDEDDCPPNAQITVLDININDPLLRKGDTLNTGKLIVNDADTESVNLYKAEILRDSDPPGLFNLTLQSWEVPPGKLGRDPTAIRSGLVLPEGNDNGVSLGRTRSSAIHVGVTIAKTIKLTKPIYMTSFNLSDRTLRGDQEKSKVTIHLRLIVESQDKSLKDTGGTNRGRPEDSRGIDGEGDHKWKGDITSAYPPVLIVPASASPFTRLAQPTTAIPFENSLTAKLYPSGSPFAVTPEKGIIYLTNPALLHVNTSFNISVRWGRNNNVATLTVKVVETNTNCRAKSQEVSCASTSLRRTCEMMCGTGAAGLCSWRKSQKAAQQGLFAMEYSTCSPDLTTCPDGFCDELEEKENKICPQDCAPEVYGTVLQNGPQYNKGRGIKVASGVCTCDDILKCSCGPVMKSSKEKATTSPGNLSGVSNGDSQHGVQPHTLDHTVQQGLGSEYAGGMIDSTAKVDNQFESCGESCFVAVALGVVAAFAIALAGAVYARRRRKLAKQGSHQLSSPISSALPVSIRPHDGLTESMAAASLGIQSQLYGQEEASGRQLQELPLLSLRPSHQQEMPPDPKWELPRNSLELEETLGEGEFGLVFRGKLKYPHVQEHPPTSAYVTVAVKTLKEDAGEMEKNALISEFKLLQNVHHSNVVRLIGACTVPKDHPFLLVIEYAELGSLRNYLRKSRLIECKGMSLQRLPITRPTSAEIASICTIEDSNAAIITPRHILSFAWQISKGMAYLSEIKLVHRDLAARNVLLALNGVCKISDFGLTRDVYEDDAYFKRSKGRVPIKWMAPESLSDHIYTTQSDVWGFGILLWELVTLGSSPYPGVPLTGLYSLLRGGYRMEKPQNCSPELYGTFFNSYRVMLCCWKLDPRMRPSFQSLMVSLEKMLQDEVEYLQLGSLMAHNLTYFNSSTDDVCPSSSENKVQYGNTIQEVVNTDDDHAASENNTEATNISQKPVEYTWLWRGKKMSRRRWEDMNGAEGKTLSQGLLSEIEEIDEDSSAVDDVQVDCENDSVLKEEKVSNHDSTEYECPINVRERPQCMPKEDHSSSEPQLPSNGDDECKL